MNGKILSLNISDVKGIIKTPVDSVVLKVDHGIIGDAHADNWHRQVSMLGIESFAKMEIQEGISLPHGSFAENITTEGIELFTLPIGTQFKIGNTVQELTQIGKQCHTGCAIAQLVGKCVMPKEGIFTKVLVGGTIHKGDEIIIVKGGE